MATLKDINDVLKEIKDDWKSLNKELITLVKDSTSAITRVEKYIEKPFYKDGKFWFVVAQIIIFSIISYIAINNGSCLELGDKVISINCEEK